MSAALDTHSLPESLEELSLRLSRARSIDEVMEAVRQSCSGLLDTDGVFFIPRDTRKCYFADGDKAQTLEQAQCSSLQSRASGAIHGHTEVVVIENIDKDRSLSEVAGFPSAMKGLIMMQVRPEEPVGVIGACWAKAGPLPSESIRIFQWIGRMSAMAMTNVALTSSLSSAREEAARARDAMIFAMTSLAETRHHETGNHIRRTQHYVRALAEAVREDASYAAQLSGDTIDLIYKSAPLHDIGKVGIPDNILLKPGKLDPDEFEVMKTHAELGRAAIAAAESHMGSTTPFLRIAKEIAYTHHEKWNGTGYPRGLKGEEIPISGRIMAIADVYDALVCRRIYKPAFSHEEAVDIILGEAGRHFDPGLVDVFARIAPRFAEIHRTFSDEA